MSMESLVQTLLKVAEDRMKKAVEAAHRDLSTIRTGRANPAILERVEVDYYGSKLPLSQVATISAPEARMLVIAPWDRNALGPIERGLNKSDVGLTPNNDGTVIRLIIPQLTEERRRDMTKLVHRKIEDGKVAVRNVRRDIIEELRSLKKAGDVAEDEEKRTEEQVQKLTDKYIYELDVSRTAKDAELMEV
jgi:ribosome recycling factor